LSAGLSYLPAVVHLLAGLPAVVHLLAGLPAVVHLLAGLPAVIYLYGGRPRIAHLTKWSEASFASRHPALSAGLSYLPAVVLRFLHPPL